MKRKGMLAVLLVLMLGLLAGCGSTTQNETTDTDGTKEQTTTTDFGSADPNGDGIVGNDGSGTDDGSIADNTKDIGADVADSIEDAADDVTGNDTTDEKENNRTADNPTANDNAR